MENTVEFNRVKVTALRRVARVAEVKEGKAKTADGADGADKRGLEGKGGSAGGAMAGTAGAAGLPGMGHRVVNFAKAAVGTARAALKTGRWYRSDKLARAVHAICRTANEEEKKKNLNFCRWYLEAEDKCGHEKCGCSLRADALVSKTRWNGTRCPDGRWDELLAKGEDQL